MVVWVTGTVSVTVVVMPCVVQSLGSMVTVLVSVKVASWRPLTRAGSAAAKSVFNFIVAGCV